MKSQISSVPNATSSTSAFVYSTAATTNPASSETRPIWVSSTSASPPTNPPPCTFTSRGLAESSVSAGRPRREGP